MGQTTILWMLPMEFVEHREIHKKAVGVFRAQLPMVDAAHYSLSLWHGITGFEWCGWIRI